MVIARLQLEVLSPKSLSELQHQYKVRRWRDESNDARLHPHGPYAMGALYSMQNVIVYYINCVAQCRRRPPLRPAFEYFM